MTSIDLPERLQKWIAGGEAGIVPREDAPEDVKEELEEILGDTQERMMPDRDELPPPEETKEERDRWLRARGIPPVDPKLR